MARKRFKWGGARENAGRPVDGEGRFAHLHVRVPPSLLDALRKHADERKETVTEVVVRLVEREVKR